MGASVPTFADSGDCWFIFCLFQSDDSPKKKLGESRRSTSKSSPSPEEQYKTLADMGKKSFIGKLEDKIKDYRDADEELRYTERKTGQDLSFLRESLKSEADAWENMIKADKDRTENPEKYYNHNALMQKARVYYMIQPNGNICMEEYLWVESKERCFPERQAMNKHIAYYDLEWIRYYDITDIEDKIIKERNKKK